MERAKKMILISKEQLDRIQREKNEEVTRQLPVPTNTFPNHTNTSPVLQSTQTVGDNLSRMDNDLKQILELNNYKDEPTRLKEYLRVLQRYLFFIDEKRVPTYPKTNVITSNSLSDDLIIESLPKLYQKKGHLLIKHLKANPDRIRWNEKGTVFIDNEKIDGSNIIDLINDTSRNRKNVKAVGRKEFSSVLREIDTPREFIGNHDLLNITTPHNNRKKKYDSDDETEKFLSPKLDLTEYTDKNISSIIDDTVLENYSTPKRSRGKSLKKSSTPKNKETSFWIGLKDKNVFRDY